MSQKLPPCKTEVEVSVFGRGFGEAIVLHLGDDRWMLVDSLKEADEQPVSLRYLNELGVDPAIAVELIVATHWHDDHVEGISEVYEACPHARMAFPQAMTSSEMHSFRSAARRYSSSSISSGVDELQAVAQTQQLQSRWPFRVAKLNSRLLSHPVGLLSHGCAIDVEALSPSDRDSVEFINTIVSETERKRPGRWAMPFDENDVSVALWVSVGDFRVLLGADLTTYADQNRGWGAIFSSPVRLTGRADIFKIPHHGSKNAHCDAVWSDLVVASRSPWAALTTWNRGRKLPSPSDVNRLMSCPAKVHITSGLGRRLRQRPKMVENKIRERGVRLTAAGPRAGHIRYRLDLAARDPLWRVDLFDEAMPLEKLKVG